MPFWGCGVLVKCQTNWVASAFWRTGISGIFTVHGTVTLCYVMSQCLCVKLSLCQSVLMLKWCCVEVALCQSGVVLKCLFVKVALSKSVFVSR